MNGLLAEANQLYKDWHNKKISDYRLITELMRIVRKMAES